MSLKKILGMFGDEHEEEMEEEKNVNVKTQKKQVENERIYETEKKVVAMNMFRGKKEEGLRSQPDLSIIRPKTFEDASMIADSIKYGKIVNFSLEQLEDEIGQRIIDFVGGAAYAMDANLIKVTDTVFVSAPNGIRYDVSGEASSEVKNEL